MKTRALFALFLAFAPLAAWAVDWQTGPSREVFFVPAEDGGLGYSYDDTGSNPLPMGLGWTDGDSFAPDLDSAPRHLYLNWVTVPAGYLTFLHDFVYSAHTTYAGDQLEDGSVYVGVGWVKSATAEIIPDTTSPSGPLYLTLRWFMSAEWPISAVETDFPFLHIQDYTTPINAGSAYIGYGWITSRSAFIPDMASPPGPVYYKRHTFQDPDPESPPEVVYFPPYISTTKRIFYTNYDADTTADPGSYQGTGHVVDVYGGFVPSGDETECPLEMGEAWWELHYGYGASIEALRLDKTTDDILVSVRNRTTNSTYGGRATLKLSASVYDSAGDESLYEDIIEFGANEEKHWAVPSSAFTTSAGWHTAIVRVYLVGGLVSAYRAQAFCLDDGPPPDGSVVPYGEPFFQSLWGWGLEISNIALDGENLVISAVNRTTAQDYGGAGTYILSVTAEPKGGGEVTSRESTYAFTPSETYAWAIPLTDITDTRSDCTITATAFTLGKDVTGSRAALYTGSNQ